MFSLTWVWINDWVNSREAGDLIRPRGHYDVNVMTTVSFKPIANFFTPEPESSAKQTIYLIDPRKQFVPLVDAYLVVAGW